MITNFEEITQELNEKELRLIPILIEGFKQHNKQNPIKAPDIVNQMNAYLSKNNFPLKMSEARLRKCCNYIRSNALLPLIATSEGYYVSQDKTILSSQIKSLRERARSINTCADGLEKLLTTADQYKF